jgi:hypothetical protein
MKFKKIITNNPSNLFIEINKKLEVCHISEEIENNVVYFCNNYDIRSATDIRNILPIQHWNNLSTDETSIFLFESSREPISLKLLSEEICYLVQLYGIKEHQFYIILPDLLFVNRLSEIFLEKNIQNVNIDYYSHWLYSVQNPTFISMFKGKTNKKKFSVLSRNYKKDRFNLFLELVNEDLIGSFNYTFHNIHPYGKFETYSNEELKKQIPVGYDINKIEKWIDGIPYSMERPGDLPINIAKDEYIVNSFINVIVETLYGKDYYYDHNYTSWITEKTYKTLMCRRPFIIFSTPHFIKDLKELGYRSFHPFIDETYDSIDDDSLRLLAIINEIKRITSLPQHHFLTLIDTCNEIVDYNYKVLLTQQKSTKLNQFKKVLEKRTDESDKTSVPIFMSWL